MSNPGPAVSTTSTPQVVSGGDSGVKVGTAASQTVGFYGSTGVAQQTGVAVTAAAVHAALVALGLITA